MGLDCSDSELDDYAELITTWQESYNRVAELPEPKLPVKYSRTPGYRPSVEENPLNAWYFKTNIKGAETGKLAGKSLAIKDNILVAGVPIINGTRLLDGYTPDIDATVVTRILDAGGLISGKANCEDMCFSGSSLTCSSGTVLNPHDTKRSTGGSSSGSGALVANGEVDMALGGDQGGSIRIPASWCGIVGLKPTFGLVPYTGIIAIEPSIDHVGPMARTVTDVALLLEVIAGYDEGRDPRQHRGTVVPEYTSLLTSDLNGVSIGLVEEGFDHCEEDVVTIVRRAAQLFTSAGARVESVNLPFHKDGPAIWSPVAMTGAGRTMFHHGSGGTGGKGYYPTTVMHHLDKAYKLQKDDMSIVTKPLALFTEYMEERYANKFYAKGANLVHKLTQQYDEALKKYDVLVMPTLPYKAPLIPEADKPKLECVRHALGMIANTSPFNATGNPALSINAGTSEGLPIGMMIVGRHFDDATVLKVAYGFEQMRDSK